MLAGRVWSAVSILAMGLVPSVSAQYYLPSTSCKGCHAVQGYDWQKSAHANAYKSPTFQEKLRAHVDAGGAEEECLRCHAPLALMKELVWDGYAEAYRNEGVTCDFCHKIVEACVIDGTGHYELAPGRVRRARLAGAFARLHDGNLRHESQYSELHGKSALCGSCHERQDEKEPIHTFSEVTESGSKESCQECHMSGRTGYASVWSTSPFRPRVTDHGFAAAEPSVEMAVSRKRDRLVIRVTNLNEAHALPTGSGDRVLEVVVSGEPELKMTWGARGGRKPLPPGGSDTWEVAEARGSRVVARIREPQGEIREVARTTP